LIARVLAFLGLGGNNRQSDPFAGVRAFLGLGGDDRRSDPFAGVRAPRSGRPSGRNSAVAVLEPDEKPESLRAIGRRLR
jgi:hypothetical protein